MDMPGFESDDLADAEASINRIGGRVEQIARAMQQTGLVLDKLIGQPMRQTLDLLQRAFDPARAAAFAGQITAAADRLSRTVSQMQQVMGSMGGAGSMPLGTQPGGAPYAPRMPVAAPAAPAAVPPMAQQPIPSFWTQASAAAAAPGAGIEKTPLDRIQHVIIDNTEPIVVRMATNKDMEGAGQGAKSGSGRVGGQSAVGGIASGFGQTAAAASAGLTGFAAAASPALFEQLTGSVKLLAGEIGIMLTPAVMKLSFLFQNAARVIRDMDGQTKNTITTMAGIASGAIFAGLAMGKMVGIIGALSPALGALGGIFKLLTGGVSLFSGGLASLASPVVLIGAGVAALVVAFGNLDGLVGGVTSILQGLYDVLMPILELVVQVGGAVGSVLVPVLAQVVEGATTLASILMGVLGKSLQLIGYLIREMIGFWSSLGTVLADAVAPALKMISDLLSPLTGAISTVGNAIGSVTGSISGAVNWLFGFSGSANKAASSAVQFASGLGSITIEAMKAATNISKVHQLLEQVKAAGGASTAATKDILSTSDQRAIAEAGKDPKKRAEAAEQIKKDAEQKLKGLGDEDQRKAKGLRAQELLEGMTDEELTKEAIAKGLGSAKTGVSDSAKEQVRRDRLRQAGYSEEDLDQIGKVGGFGKGGPQANLGDVFTADIARQKARVEVANKIQSESSEKKDKGKEPYATAQIRGVNVGFNAIDQFKKSIQTANLQDSLQQAQLEQQRRAADAMQESVAETKGLRQDVQKINTGAGR